MNEWTKAKKSSSGRLLGSIIYPSIHVFILPSIFSSIHPASQPSMHLYIQPASHLSFHLFIQLSIHPSILPPIYPSCHPFIYLFSYLCNTYLLSSYYMPSNVLGSGRTVGGTVRESLSPWDYTVCIQSTDYTENQPAGYIIANRSSFHYLSSTLFARSALAMLASLLSFKHTASSVSVTLVFLSRHLFLQDLLANSLVSFKFLHRFLLLSESCPDHSI